MKTRIIAALCAVFMVGTILAGCGADNREALKVNDEKITKGEFAFYLESMKQLMIQEASLEITDEDSWNTVEIENRKAIDVAKDKALDEVVKVAVQVQKAKEAGIKLDTNDDMAMSKQKNNMIQSYGGTDKFNELLSKCGLNALGFDRILENYVYASKLEYKTVSDPSNFTFTDEELFEVYARANARVKHILVLFEKEDGTTRTEEQALNEAKALLERAKGGEDFDKLVEQYSEDPGSKTSPEGYTMVEGDNQMVKEFSDASFALGVGDISEPVKTTYGYHIIKRYPVENLKDTFESAKKGVMQKLGATKYDELVEKWKNEATIVKNDELIASVK